MGSKMEKMSPDMEEDEELETIQGADDRIEGHMFEKLPLELEVKILSLMSGAEFWGLHKGLDGSLDSVIEEFCRRSRHCLRLPEDIPFARDPAGLFKAMENEETEKEMAQWLAQTFGHVTELRLVGNWNAWFFAVIERLYQKDSQGLDRYRRWILRPKNKVRQEALNGNLASVVGWKLLLSIHQLFPNLRHFYLQAPQGSYYPRWTNGRDLPVMDIVRDASVWPWESLTYAPSPENDARLVDFRPLLEACPTLSSINVLPSDSGFVHPDYPYR